MNPHILWNPTIKSSSVILIQQIEYENQCDDFDYKVYLFKRHKATHYGGMYAYPGGKVESQDMSEHWETTFQKYYEQYKHYEDFTLRITCLRELYEECGILPGYKDSIFQFISIEDLKNSKFSQDQFGEYCCSTNIFPAIDQLYGWKRVGSPIYLPKQNDTQFYIFFLPKECPSLTMNPTELTKCISETPSRLFELQSDDKLQLFIAQSITLSYLFPIKKYDELLAVSESTNR